MNIPKSAIGAALAILAPTNANPAGRAPGTYTTPFIRVSRVGGGMRNLVIDSARLLIECYAPNSVVAEDLANHARALLATAPGQVFGGARIHYWDDSSDGPVEFDDPDTKWSRFQFVGQLDISTQ